MILLSHPTGNQNSRHAAKAYSDDGQLISFATAFSSASLGDMFSLLPASIRSELARRNFSDVAEGQVVSVAPIREITRLVSQKLGLEFLTHQETGWASVDAVYHAVDRAAAKRIRTSPEGITAVHAYEDGALETFKAAMKHGIARIYELPIGYWRTHGRLCDEEANFSPEWAHTWQASSDSAAKLKRKDKELALASHIIVPSQFVANSLKEYQGVLPPVSIIPYGCPESIKPESRSWYSGGKLKLLYVGGLTQRKGLSYLLDAVIRLGDAVELTIIGTGSGGLLLDNRHRYLGSVPHSVVLDELRQHDIFLFPTFFEGYSLAVAEALSQGLPVVTTQNSGVADIIEDGKQGWIVPVRDSEAIASRLQQCLDTPKIVTEMGQAALSLAGNYSWGHYRKNLCSVVLGMGSE
jgi:alpha-maltose-1-phosphate synthase